MSNSGDRHFEREGCATCGRIPNRVVKETSKAWFYMVGKPDRSPSSKLSSHNEQ